GSEFHAELAGCGWSLNSQGTPRYGDLCDNAGSLSAKIMRYRPGNGLTGAIGEATEVGLGVRGAVFPIFFWWHHIQCKTLWPCSRIAPPVQMKVFPNGDRLAKCQQLRVIIIHSDGRQVDPCTIPGQIHVAKGLVRRGRGKTWRKGPFLGPFDEGAIVG